MDKTLYPNHLGYIEQFGRLLENRINPDDCVLDYGAGRGRLAAMNFKGKTKLVAGIDVDEDVLGNPFLDEAKILQLPDARIPFADETFDLAFSHSVVEHLPAPEVCFAEVYRILKPGGLFISKTPNKWHYAGIVARLLPHAFHERLAKVLLGRQEHDTFPTLYRCNTSRVVRRYARRTGFAVEELQMWEGRPTYLRLIAPLYLIGFLYERFVNSAAIYAGLRSVMVFTLRKPGGSPTSASPI